MTHITKKSKTVYMVNDKEVDVSQPQYGANLEANEYRALMKYRAALKQQIKRQIEEENKYLFN